MADVTLNNDVSDFSWNTSFRGQVFTTASIGYQVYRDESDGDLYYTKTADGGATWGTPVAVRASGLMGAVAVWFDKWTPGDSGTKIHIAVIDLTPDDVFYYSLDTASDTLAGPTTIFTGSTASALVENISITKAIGGNLYCYADIDGGTEHVFARSVDAGANWTARTSPNESAFDLAILLPGNGADNQDPVAIWVDGDADQTSVKEHDDSANTWPTETAIGSYNGLALTTRGVGLNAAVRHSDNHIILAVANDAGGAGNDVECWDINPVIGAVTVTQKTNVISNTIGVYNATVAINQTTGRIFVAYNRGTLGTSSTVYYKYSDDGGTSWSTEQAMMANAAANVSNIQTSLSVPDSFFLPAWGLMDVNDVFVNTDNSVPPAPPSAPSVRHLALLGVGT